MRRTTAMLFNNTKIFKTLKKTKITLVATTRQNNCHWSSIHLDCHGPPSDQTQSFWALSFATDVCRCSLTHCEISLVLTPAPFPSSRHHLSYDDCLEDKRGKYQNCSVLCCVRQLYIVICTHIWAVLKDECCFRFRFSFCTFVLI